MWSRYTNVHTQTRAVPRVKPARIHASNPSDHESAPAMSDADSDYQPEQPKQPEKPKRKRHSTRSQADIAAILVRQGEERATHYVEEADRQEMQNPAGTVGTFRKRRAGCTLTNIEKKTRNAGIERATKALNNAIHKYVAQVGGTFLCVRAPPEDLKQGDDDPVMFKSCQCTFLTDVPEEEVDRVLHHDALRLLQEHFTNYQLVNYATEHHAVNNVPPTAAPTDDAFKEAELVDMYGESQSNLLQDGESQSNLLQDAFEGAFEGLAVIQQDVFAEATAAAAAAAPTTAPVSASAPAPNMREGERPRFRTPAAGKGPEAQG